MEMFHRILKTAVDGGASDIHLKIGTPVVFRINRQLIAIECPYPTLEWMNSIVAKITPVHLKDKLQEQREIDFSYYVPAINSCPAALCAAAILARTAADIACFLWPLGHLKGLLY